MSPVAAASPPIGFHTDLFLPSGAYSFSTTGIGTLDPKTNTLTTPIPPTGTSLTHFEVSIGKVKSGKKKGKPTYYVMARCKKKKWSDAGTESFSDGSSRSSTSVQKCKAKKSRRLLQLGRDVGQRQPLARVAGDQGRHTVLDHVRAVHVHTVHQQREDHRMVGVIAAAEAVTGEGAHAVERAGLDVAVARRRRPAHPFDDGAAASGDRQ